MLKATGFSSTAASGDAERAAAEAGFGDDVGTGLDDGAAAGFGAGAVAVSRTGRSARSGAGAGSALFWAATGTALTRSEGPGAGVGSGDVAAGSGRATGAGAGAQNAIGTAVVGGMISATFVDLLFIPLFFVLVTRFFEKGRKQSVAGASDVPASQRGL